MDITDLHALAERGFATVPASRLSDLADWAWDWGEATGDARYCSVSRTFSSIDIWWSEHKVIPLALCTRIDDLLQSHLPAILASDSSADASALARALRVVVHEVLLPPEQWAASTSATG